MAKKQTTIPRFSTHSLVTIPTVLPHIPNYNSNL
jgi:hypothetical protein